MVKKIRLPDENRIFYSEVKQSHCRPGGAQKVPGS